MSQTTSTDRVALVTGAARGIGQAIAIDLHGRGLRVALLDRDGTAVQDLARGLDPDGHTAMALCADVDEPAQLETAVTTVAAQWHSPDVLVNNAARTVSNSVWDIELDEWDGLMATNLRSVLILTRLCAPAMRDRGWGRVVNLASLAGQQGGQVAGAHYAAAKAGVLVLTKIFARELAASGVTVNALAPATVRTPVMDDLPEDALDRAEKTIPVGRFGRPQEVAAAVSYLVGEDAGYVTGATLDINGGGFMR
ncbi:MAG TPA: SDR family NAD(P)-dependent oxidoreductase [Pseudonocardiaceae bacterium]|jgi:3-oxoacyl-[acyl-carrier protein] reductase|nr:SDR family NAD(P)-dependent oxidoreductase [Pseudonocardiaceae bacterium]